MDKQPLLVAMSNQKGGVGKSAFTILLASYYHYVKKSERGGHRLRLSAT